MVKGNITKSAGKYTVTVFKDGEKVFSDTGILDLDGARAMLKSAKKHFSDVESFKRDYPEFIGKYIIWTNSKFKNGKPVVGVVVGCNYWVGLTIIDANDHNIYLTCQHGPLSPRGKKLLAGNPERFKQIKYDDRFKNSVEMLADGKYSVDENTKIYSSSGSRPTSASCPFNQ